MFSVLFVEVIGVFKVCLGFFIVIWRLILMEIGGLESLVDYLVEDFELGQWVWMGGLKMVLLFYVIDVGVNLDNWINWWSY